MFSSSAALVLVLLSFNCSSPSLMLGLAVLVHSQSGLWSGVRPALQGEFIPRHPPVTPCTNPTLQPPAPKLAQLNSSCWEKLPCFFSTAVKLDSQTEICLQHLNVCLLGPSSEKSPKKLGGAPRRVAHLPLPPHHTTANPKLTLPSNCTDTQTYALTHTSTKINIKHTLCVYTVCLFFVGVCLCVYVCAIGGEC